MKICVLGWYGTETIGDRAILAGIFSLLNKKLSDFEVDLGSLYPFYSERMIVEDKKLYRLLLNRDLTIRLFNSKDQKQLRQSVETSDIVIVGGGPLMDLPELYMLKYAFSYAKEMKKRTMIFSCGIGPLFHEEYQRCVLDIVSKADRIILRDFQSRDNLLEIAKKMNSDLIEKNITIAFDPAVECACMCKRLIPEISNASQKDVVINFRDFPLEYSQNFKMKERVNSYLKDFLKYIRESYCDFTITLAPMHYFNIGSDDRVFLNRLLFELGDTCKNIVVQNKPLSLLDTIILFSSAKFAFGMRFHSVVLQTVLNGNNYILDYTEPFKGKIFGFLKDIDHEGFYEHRYINLQRVKNAIDFPKLNINSSQFVIPDAYYKTNVDKYDEIIDQLF